MRQCQRCKELKKCSKCDHKKCIYFFCSECMPKHSLTHNKTQNALRSMIIANGKAKRGDKGS